MVWRRRLASSRATSSSCSRGTTSSTMCTVFGDESAVNSVICYGHVYGFLSHGHWCCFGAPGALPIAPALGMSSVSLPLTSGSPCSCAVPAVSAANKPMTLLFMGFGASLVPFAQSIASIALDACQCIHWHDRYKPAEVATQQLQLHLTSHGWV